MNNFDLNPPSRTAKADEKAAVRFPDLGVGKLKILKSYPDSLLRGSLF
jgi:hypothetical protein